jgi:NAD(P)-dependent dehydrogenase (short-subunit alcohol dehydrogenase family)
MTPEADAGAVRRTAVVTGGTDGIGNEIARGLVRGGMAVFAIGRDAAKGARWERDLREQAGHADVHFLQADLGLMREVDRVADLIAARSGALHHLVLNAGVINAERRLTTEGIETHFAISYLGRFRLVTRLLRLLDSAGRPGKSARILLVSGGATGGTVHFEDVNLTANYGLLRAIRQMCHALDVFTVDLARRLAALDADPRVTIACLKLGPVKTNIRATFPLWMKGLMPLIDPFVALTPRQAADAALRLLLADEFEGATGTLYRYVRTFKPLAPDAATLDPSTGQRLRELSECLIAQALNGRAEPRSLAPGNHR